MRLARNSVKVRHESRNNNERLRLAGNGAIVPHDIDPILTWEFPVGDSDILNSDCKTIDKVYVSGSAYHVVPTLANKVRIAFHLFVFGIKRAKIYYRQSNEMNN